MLKSNLKVLLAERDLKITQVSFDTGISRTTLTSLIFGYAKGIQFETMNTLCNYLKVTPNDLFLYLPYEIKIEPINKFHFKTGSANNYLDFSITITKDRKENDFWFTGYLYNFEEKFDIEINPYDYTEKLENEKKELEIIKSHLKQLPIQFLKDVENEIKKLLLSELEYSDFYENINKDKEDEDKIQEKDVIINIEWSFLND